MQKLNKYGNLSGGFISDYLDKQAHKKAIELIDECETLELSVNYMGKITETDLEKTIYTLIKVGNNKVHITTNTNNKVFGRFIFIKRK